MAKGHQEVLTLSYMAKQKNKVERSIKRKAPLKDGTLKGTFHRDYKKNIPF